jgi:HlyD family secretion protein
MNITTLWRKIMIQLRLLMLLFIPILFISGCTTEPLKADQQREEVIPVQAEEVVLAPFSQRLELSGRSRSKQDLPILAPTPMKVKEVYVQVGQEVKEGDILLQFEDEQARTQLKDAQRQVEQLENALADVEKIQREAAQAAQATQAENQETIERAQAVLDGAQTGAVTMLDLLQASTQLLLLQNQMQTIQGNALSSVNPTQLNLQLEQAKAQVKLAEQAVEQLSITAPFDGVITARHIEPKGVATPSFPLLQLSQLQQIIVDVQVGSTQVDQLKAGMKAYVLFEGEQEPIEATLDTLSPGVGIQGNLYQAQIRLNNQERSLLPGKLAKIEVEVKHFEQSLLVPVQAVFFQEDQAHVYAVQNDRALLKEIQLGERNRTYYRVLGGLEENELVITTGRDQVTDGKTVYLQK